MKEFVGGDVVPGCRERFAVRGPRHVIGAA